MSWGTCSTLDQYCLPLCLFSTKKLVIGLPPSLSGYFQDIPIAVLWTSKILIGPFGGPGLSDLK